MKVIDGYKQRASYLLLGVLVPGWKMTRVAHMVTVPTTLLVLLLYTKTM